MQGWHSIEDLLKWHKPDVNTSSDSFLSESFTWYNICLRVSIVSLRYIMRQRGQVEAGGAPSRPEPPMHLAVVACGERLEETLTMIKSAVLFSLRRLYLHIFAEDQLHASFMEAVSRKYLG